MALSEFDPLLQEQENTVEDWLHIATRNMAAWAPDIFFDELRTPRRNAYASIFKSPKAAMALLSEKLHAAKKRDPKPFHIMNIEAPGGCWELGTQINPDVSKITAPNGYTITSSTYRLVYLICHALVVDDTDEVRHQCNNRACIRPDHMLLGSHAQNMLDEERRIYAGNSPQGRGQALHAHVPKHLQKRPDPFVEEPLDKGDVTDARPDKKCP